MMTETTVLAFTPVYRLEPETVEAMHGQTWEGRWHWLLGYANPHPQRRDPRGIQNTLYQYNRGRDVFLAGTWDWFWTVESDIIPPADALERMLAIAEEKGADVVRAPYLYRQPWPAETVALGIHHGHNARNRGEALRKPWPTGIIPVSGAGLGCSLFRREVVERVEFRHGGAAHCDTYFNDDIWWAGFTNQWADMSMWCGHKTPEGEIIWPKSVCSSPAS